MAVHDKFVTMALRLIDKHGRTVTLRKLSRDPADPAKPWRGPSSTPAAGFEFEQPVKAFVASYESDEVDGEQIRREDKRLLVAADPSIAVNLLDADEMEDSDGRVYGVVLGDVIEPGTTRILYDFQVRA